jgi:hypothetical protein
MQGTHEADPLGWAGGGRARTAGAAIRRIDHENAKERKREKDAGDCRGVAGMGGDCRREMVGQMHHGDTGTRRRGERGKLRWSWAMLAGRGGAGGELRVASSEWGERSAVSVQRSARRVGATDAEC